MDSDDDALLKSQHINTMGQFWVRLAEMKAEARSLAEAGEFPPPAPERIILIVLLLLL